MLESPDSETLLDQIAKALLEKKAQGLALFDVRGRSSLADYYVVATAMNTPHLKALANELRLRMKAIGAPSLGQSGTPDTGWIVADYVDIVVHILTRPLRNYYALDDLWKDMLRVHTLEAGAWNQNRPV